MKKSQQANKINHNIKEQTESAIHDKHVRSWFHNISARHFRANSYVPLLLALRPRAGGLVVALMAILGLSLFSSVSVSATSLTLTIPATPLTLEVVPDGRVKTSSNSSISVSTDALSGYSLAIKAKDVDGSSAGSSNALVNKTNPSFVIPSIPAGSKLDEAEYNSGDQYLNTWAFKPSKLEGSSNDKYLPAPTTDPVTIDKTTTSNSDVANSYSIAIAARLDSTIPAGAYTNTFIITASANATKYTINYNLNGGMDSAGSPTMQSQSGSTTDLSVNLDPTTPLKAMYAFRGWCTAETSTETCSGVTYQPGQAYNLTADDETVELYAIWEREILLTDLVDSITGTMTFKAGAGIAMIMVADGGNKWTPYYAFPEIDVTLPTTGQKLVVTVVPEKNYRLDSWEKIHDSASATWTAKAVSGAYIAMQNLDPTDCSTAGDKGLNVLDTRNGISYTVGMFANNCFMYSNLRLEPGMSLTPATSDVASEFILPTQEDSDAWIDDSRNYFSKKNMKVCRSLAGYREEWDSHRSCDQGTYGVLEYYYNWYAATANDNEGIPPTDPNLETQELDAGSKGSICPKGWRLLDEDKGEVTSLANAWNADSGNNPGRLAATSVFTYLDGNFISWPHGYWWASPRHTNAHAAILLLRDGKATESIDQPKRDGELIRCILR